MRAYRPSSSLLFRLLFTFITVVMLTPQLHPQSPTRPDKSTADSLKLPSLSIFGFGPHKTSKSVERPFDPNELERFLAEVAKDELKQVSRKERAYYWIIPMVIYQIRDLFSKESWTAEEIMQGQQASRFFAKLVKRPDLRIEKRDQNSFRKGLVGLRDWFASLCQNNEILAAMIFTLDDGPYFGEYVDVKEYLKMSLVEAVPIPGKQAMFVLMTDSSQAEPMVIGVLNEDKSVKWLKRYSNPPNRITWAELEKPGLYQVEGYGYAIALMTEGSSGVERSRVYLDEALNLRFYYVSW